MVVWSVSEKLPVQTLLLTLDGVCCVLQQDTLSALSQSSQLKVDSGLCWECTCDGLVFHPGKIESMTSIHFAAWILGKSICLMSLDICLGMI